MTTEAPTRYCSTLLDASNTERMNMRRPDMNHPLSTVYDGKNLVLVVRFGDQVARAMEAEHTGYFSPVNYRSVRIPITEEQKKSLIPRVVATSGHTDLHETVEVWLEDE